MGNPHRNWEVPADWVGETAFVVAGGLSVEKQNLALLRDRRVIVINTTYEKMPWAPYLFTMDGRWMRHHQSAVTRKFQGKIVTNTSTVVWPGLLVLDRVAPPGLAMQPTATAGLRTSLHGAINMAAHLIGATRGIEASQRKIVVLGADGGGVTYDGRTHHHTAHPWRPKSTCFEDQHRDLVTIVEPLKELGIELLNCSPGTKWADLWPVVDRLEDCL